jgi:hypothetical protein
MTQIDYEALGQQYGQAAAKICRSVLEAMPSDGDLAPWRTLLDRAQRGAYSEYFGEFDAPINQLVADLRAAGAEDLAQRAIDGKFDADAEESKRWGEGDEAKAIFKSLAQRPVKPLYSDVARKGRRQPWREQ